MPQENIPFQSIDITGFRRKLSVDNLKTVMRFIQGVRKSKKMLKEFKPDVVIGTGGYVCGPVVYAAAKLGIPSVIHEQNAIPGLTNKFLTRYVDTVAVSFEGSEKAFSGAKRVVYTGNPRATTVAKASRDRGFATLGCQWTAGLCWLLAAAAEQRPSIKRWWTWLPCWRSWTMYTSFMLRVNPILTRHGKRYEVHLEQCLIICMCFLTCIICRKFSPAPH